MRDAECGTRIPPRTAPWAPVDCVPRSCGWLATVAEAKTCREARFPRPASRIPCLKWSQRLRLKAMFDELSEKLEATFARLRGRGVLTEADIKEGLREVRRVLLEADVNFQLTREFLERVEKAAVGVSALKSISPAQQLVKIVHDELTAMLGERREGLKLSSVPPTVVMMVGLQGSGKTTTAAKLALKLQKEQRQTRLIAADVYRPAAIDQLETLGKQLDVPVYSDRSTQDVVKIAKAGLDQSRRERDRVTIVDTAGRLQIDDDMMQELERLKAAIKPDEILLVADGMTGQDAVKI